MMDETKQSDSSIVAMKRANKEGRPSAELVERRGGTKGNSVRQSTRRTQRRGSVSQAVDRIRRAIANGWLNYFAVPGSTRWLQGFCYLLQRRWLRALRRRSQRDRFSWRRLRRMTKLLWPSVRVRHPWPGQRFRWPFTPKVGAVCLNGHARICAGGGRKLPFLP